MIEIVNFKSIQKNYLQGMITIKIPKWGNFIIHDISYFVKGDNRWISFPCKSYQNEGKTKYFHLNRFEAADMMKTFQGKVLESLDKYLLENKIEQKTEQKDNQEQQPLPF